MIRYLTAGESHGECLVGILEGMPAGMEIREDEITSDLHRRQLGYGRGERMKIETDHARILSGVRYGKTLGSPIALMIANRDAPNWKSVMRVDEPPENERATPVTTPRPGHADFAGAIKFGHDDLRNVLERASARETAMRVALGAICRKLLSEFGIHVGSHVLQIGAVKSSLASPLIASEINGIADASRVRCLNGDAEEKMVAAIDRAIEKEDTLGGMFEIVADGLPVGIGDGMHPDRRVDAILAAAVMSIPAVKSVGFGGGEEWASLCGHAAHDTIYSDAGQIRRRSNHAGGVEGGMSNGEPLVIRATMKPLPTLRQPLSTIDLNTGDSAVAFVERGDVCAVPAAAVVAEAVVMLALINPLLEKWGGDSIHEIHAHKAASDKRR